MNTDYFIFQQLNNLAGHYKAVEYLVIFFGNYFPWLLAAALVIFISLGKNKEEKKQNRIIAVVGFASGLISRFFFTETIWFFYFRPRPYVVHQAFQYIYPMTKESFPSGHAAFFFGLAAAVYFLNKKVGWWFLGGAFLICVARVFAGVHYPADILIGALIGIFTGWISTKYLIKIINKKRLFYWLDLER
jgi:undecaprenyl-diphosphatase